jgi:hypothetical protein
LSSGDYDVSVINRTEHMMNRSQRSSHFMMDGSRHRRSALSERTRESSIQVEGDVTGNGETQDPKDAYRLIGWQLSELPLLPSSQSSSKNKQRRFPDGRVVPTVVHLGLGSEGAWITRDIGGGNSAI